MEPSLAVGCLGDITEKHPYTYALRRLSPSPAQKKNARAGGKNSLDDEIPKSSSHKRDYCSSLPAPVPGAPW